jgi:subtilisin
LQPNRLRLLRWLSLPIGLALLIVCYSAVGDRWPNTVSASGQLGATLISSERLSRLQDKVSSGGSARVIVGVRVPFVSPGRLASPDAIAAQDRSIANAQSALALRLVGGRARVLTRFAHIPYIALSVDQDALSQLLSDPDVTSLQEDIPVPPDLAESVPLIGGTNAWESGFTGAGWAVAILDTGVDSTHPFLVGKVISEACYSTTEPLDSAVTICPNGSSAQIGAGAGGNCPIDVPGCQHGTHVAGIAAGRSYPGVAFSGVAKDADVIAIQVFSMFGSSPPCGGSTPCVMSYTSDYIQGLERVYDLRTTYSIAAVNMSLGSGGYDDQNECDLFNYATKTAIDNLRSVGIATVISSGNSGYTNALGAPGCISSAVSVGATTKADAVAGYSNYASFLSILAPGSAITSSVAGGGFEAWNGTSMAAPHVTGSWALLKQAYPDLSVADALNELRTTGVLVTDYRNGQVVPRIEIDAAIDSLILTGTPTATPTRTATTTPSATPTASSTPNATATPSATPTASSTPLATTAPPATATATGTGTATVTSVATASTTPGSEPTPGATTTPEPTTTVVPTPTPGRGGVSVYVPSFRD